jgi:1-aminocyclopropane-1-carboxylate deaminase/D-cysteine desulfhydrase-like pyridoxal-dependent ACC family enzyme
MREDLTGFGLGRNKVRKLDFLIGDAIEKKSRYAHHNESKQF